MAGCNGDTDMENTVNNNNDNNTTDNNVNNNLTNNVVDYKASDIVGFYFHERDGMIKLPHYLITKTDNGMFVKITGDISEDVFENADTKIDEYASLVSISEEEFNDLIDMLIKHNILQLDGYYESRKSGALDSGDGFELIVKLSDGKEINAYGYNTYFDGYDDFKNDFMHFIDNHTDYSEYQITDFTNLKPDRLIMRIQYGNYLQFYSIELNSHRKQWSIVLKDSRGIYLKKGTDIEGYDKVENLEYDRFLKIIDKHLDLKETSNTVKTNITFTIYITADGNKSYVNSQDIDESNEEFIKEIINEIYDYYNELKK